MEDIFKIEIPIFKMDFYFSTNEKAICEKFELEPCCALGWSTLVNGNILMYLTSTEDLSILCHECFHAAMQVCKRVGIEISADDDEVAAYLAEWFFSEVQKFTLQK